MSTPTEKRRSIDPIVAKLVEDVDSVKRKLDENTEITNQVRDILASFRVLMVVAKWFTIIAGAITAGIAMLKAGAGVEIKIR